MQILGLCKGRHDLPVDSYIFNDAIINPTDIIAINKIVMESLQFYKNDSITIYVTGLTVALIEVLNVCKKFNISVILMHFDISTSGYYPQSVL
jgi:hypothetical protein